MSAFQGIIDDLDLQTFTFFEEEFKAIDLIQKKRNCYLERINRALQLYKQTGEDPGINLQNWEASDEEVDNGSSKENIMPEKTFIKEENTLRITRSKIRNALKKAPENNEQETITKKRATTQTTRQNIKVEKINEENDDIPETRQTVFNQSEDDDVMPAPTRPAPKRKGRTKKTSVKVKSEKLENELSSFKIKEEKLQEEAKKTVRDSDVILEEQPITIVTLDDSIEETPLRESNAKGKRSKRSHEKVSEGDEEASGNKEKRSKSDQESIDNNNDNNKTFVADSNPQQSNIMNATIVVENPKYLDTLTAQNPEDLITDDESYQELKKSTSIPVATVSKSKQIFSPFELSPVKKKVQAFERLHEEVNAKQQCATRAQTQAKNKERALSKSSVKSKVADIVKHYTPVSNKFVPKVASTALKSTNHNDSTLMSSSTLTASSLKSSRTDYREREQKRLEKEENMRKREAAIQAEMEERKRKREERQLKAQQAREAQEKEKLKALEIQKIKDARHKQLVAEQEERKQKMKEEAEKKRMLAKMRAVEEKQKEEKKRLEDERKAKELVSKLTRQDETIRKIFEEQKKNKIPIYMRTKPPRLPTDDCYDSDEEDVRTNKVQLEWVRSSKLYAAQLRMQAAGETIKNTFFSIQAQSADLQDIFEVIQPDKLKRSSSAVWHKPPRFTLIPGLEHCEVLNEED